MKDIVERLRALEAWIRKPTDPTFRLNTDLFDEAADEIERLRAALETIDHGWEVPMEERGWRALARFMWETARAALETPTASAAENTGDR